MESMNLAESMMYVLKNRRGALLTSFWKSDLKLVFKDVKKDLSEIIKASAGKLSTIKNQSVKETFADVKESTIDSVTVFKVVPNRIREAFHYFHQDLVDEMEAHPDQKQKTLFCLKVIGVLSSFTLKTIYGVKKSRHDLQIHGLKMKSAFAHVIASELLVRIIHVFTVRMINEIEAQMNDEEEKKKLHYFKSLLSNFNSVEPQQDMHHDLEHTDRAFAIVEAFKTYILTGKRVQP